MAINERLIHTAADAAGAGTGNQEEGLILHLDANDVDSYDGDGTVWYDIKDYEYTPATNADEHFNTIIWDGDGSTNRDITGVGFAPDLVWIKRYAPAYVNRDHRVFDTLRGAGKVIYPSGTYKEATPTNELNGFLNDGFNVGNSDAVNANVYGVEKYVAWCLKAGGAPSGSDKVSIDDTSYATMAAAGLTDGTEPISKLSVNTKLGLSIVKYTAPALIGDTVAHGIGQTPEMIILKSTDVQRNWNVFHKDVGISKNLHLNTADSANTSEYWTANSTTFSIQDYSSSADWVAYCFASKRGVSKVGSYTGTGTSGNKIYTGFQPAFVMIKNTTSASSNWMMYDIKRDTDGTINAFLEANTIDAEATAATATVSPNRDGFTLGNSNSVHLNESGDTFIYLAFAKNTKETSLIPDTNLELHLDADSFPEYGEVGYSNIPSIWTDISGNGYNSTISNALFDSELGNWLDFNGSNAVVTVPSATITPIDPTLSFSISLWVRQDDLAGHQTYVAKYGGSTSLQSFIFGLDDSTNKMRLIEATGSGFNIRLSNSTITTNSWTHIVVTSTSSAVKFYINGTLDATITRSQTRVTGGSQDITIGSRPSSVQPFDGQIGQTRIYSSALTEDEVRQNYNFTKNNYPNGINADRTNTPTWDPSGYWDFDGGLSNADSFSLPQSLTLNPWFTNTHTVSMWVNFDSFASYPTFWSTYDYTGGSSYGTILRADNDGRIRQAVYFNNSLTNQFSGVLSTGQWYHIVGSFSQGDCRLYIDKVHIGTNTGTFNYPGGGGRPTLGALRYSTANTTDNGHDGKISKFKLYDRLLTTDEIQTLYDEGY